MKLQVAIDRVTLEKAESLEGDAYKLAAFYRFEVFEQMSVLIADADKLETLVDAEIWPLPTYEDLLFTV